MSIAKINFDDFKAEAFGTCEGGHHPDPPIDAYPLLAWSALHPAHGSMVVHTEDGKASVHDIAVAACEIHSVEALAAKFGTTEQHVDQAIRYAVASAPIKS